VTLLARDFNRQGKAYCRQTLLVNSGLTFFTIHATIAADHHCILCLWAVLSWYGIKRGESPVRPLRAIPALSRNGKASAKPECPPQTNHASPFAREGVIAAEP